MPPAMSPQSSLYTWGCRRPPCARAPLIRGVLANSMTAECLCTWLSQLSCWPLYAELLSPPAPENYLEYLRFKLRRIASGKTIGAGNKPANVQKDTFSDDR